MLERANAFIEELVRAADERGFIVLEASIDAPGRIRLADGDTHITIAGGHGLDWKAYIEQLTALEAHRRAERSRDG